MNRIVLLLIALVFSFATVRVFAAPGGQKGPSDKAYEQANENAKFKRDADWVRPGGQKGPSDKAYEQANENAKFKRDADWVRPHKGKKENMTEEGEEVEESQ